MATRTLNVEKVTFSFDGRDLQFVVANRRDEIQQHLVRGCFYEIDQLLLHRHLIPKGGVVLDIGANIGNHTVFYSLFCNTHSVLPVEPMPTAIAMLKTNLQLNSCKNVVGNFIGFGCGARSETRYISRIYRNNLGGTELQSREETDGKGIQVKVVPGDKMVPSNLTVDFVKIDVENMELDVLSGLEKTIERCRPSMSVEVGRGNGTGFQSWVDRHNYRIEKTFHMYRGVRTLVVVPRD